MPLFKRKDNRYSQAARLLSDGYPKDAIEMLESLIVEQPDHENAMVTLAIALLEVQEEPAKDDSRTVRAFSLLDRAISLNPSNPVPQFNKGVCLRKMGLLEEALESFESVLSIENRHTLSILHMAEINYELERWEKAIELAKLALIRDPGIESALTWVKDAMIKGGLMEDDLNVAEDKLPTRPF